MPDTNPHTNLSTDADANADGAIIEQLLPPFDESTSSLTECDDRHAVILEEAESLPQYHHGAVSILCPGCGEFITRFTDGGLPDRLVHFEQMCDTCDVQLYRWCSVAVPSALEHKYSPAELEQIVTSQFDRRIWNGIVSNPGGHPHNWEFSEAYSKKATDFGWKWNVSCPLCRRSIEALPDTWLDYHHWQHEPDQGVCLCRHCHESLSAGESDSDQNWTAKQQGFKNKHDIQIARLALREQVVAQHQTSSELIQTVIDRYNLPYNQREVRMIVKTVLTDPDKRQLVINDQLLNGI
jgi:hypothetical protein